MNVTIVPVAPNTLGPARVATKEFASDRKRLAREYATLVAMVRIYCADKHGDQEEPCQDCGALLDYAYVRLDRCRFGEEKPTCAKCPVHCYQSARREQVKVVMRYAGPRMLWKHPLMSLRHWLDSWRSLPA